MISRRTVLAGVATTLLAPSAVLAQPRPKPVRLGVLLFSDPGSDPNMRAAREALRERGYVEGQNLSIEYRYAEGRPERLRDLGADLVRTRPDAIFALGGDVAPHAKAATSTIPIVVVVSGNPVTGGLAASLAAPGGNVTGVTLITSELAGKRLQYLKQAAPRVSKVAVIWSPLHHDDELAEAQAAGRSLGFQVHSAEVRNGAEFTAVLQAALAAGVDGVMAVSSRQIFGLRPAIVDFAARHRLPLAAGWGPWTESGALLSYGPDVSVAVRRAVTHHLDRVFKGTKPAELPMEQPTKFDLTINLKTASALGLAIPQNLVLQAERIVQ
ncbi:MAG TPA: ABC transporter substrate-binding protein [Terriglobales bacterium]|nr:ABC transporter substrate-binding protein [Terriglobales bacterium]